MRPDSRLNGALHGPKVPKLAAGSIDTQYSSYREMLIEHLLVAEVMRSLWLRGITRFEVLKPQVDDSGYDLVLEANGFSRHVQLKSASTTAKTAVVTASLGLGLKPSGCIIWVRFDPKSLQLGPFLWFGGEPGEPLPDIRRYQIGKHTKGNAQGVKKERPNTRVIPRKEFQVIADVPGVVARLFGEFKVATAAV